MSTATILMNDFARQWAEIREDALGVFDDVGSSGWYILGQRVRHFEVALSQYWGIGQSVGVANGLDALELALRAAGMQPGDRVLTTPLSAFATTLAIIRAGGVPVFCDTTPLGLIDLAEARAALRAMPGIRYFVPVHLYGFPLDPVELRTLVEEFDLICIEDCAQSIGATFGEIATGTTGIAAGTSFYPTKNLGAMGDGGAVLTSDPELAERVRILRDYGQSAKYKHAVIGSNSRLDELHAALLDEVFLPRLSRWTERRREIANRFLDGWDSSLVYPIAKNDKARREWRPSWHLFPVRTSAALKVPFMQWLRTQGITTGEHYPILIPDQSALLGVNSVCFGALEMSRTLAAEEVSLPIHPYLSDAEIESMLRAVASFSARQAE